MYTLPETELMRVSFESKDRSRAAWVIEPLLPGFGITLGNALRRVLLSSLSGSAITSVKIEGIMHEFSTIKGVREDMVDVILNLKTTRMSLDGVEPVTLHLQKKGLGTVTAADFDQNAGVTFVDPGHVICNLERDGKIEMEVTVEHGRGYVPTEERKFDKLPIGMIAIDSIFSPMKKVHYEVEHTRVEGMTNFDRLTLEVETDQTITAVEATRTAIRVLIDHFGLLFERMPTPSGTKKGAKTDTPEDAGAQAIPSKEARQSKKTLTIQKATAQSAPVKKPPVKPLPPSRALAKEKVKK